MVDPHCQSTLIEGSKSQARRTFSKGKRGFTAFASRISRNPHFDSSSHNQPTSFENLRTIGGFCMNLQQEKIDQLCSDLHLLSLIGQHAQLCQQAVEKQSTFAD